MSAASPFDLAALLARLDGLSHGERLREAAALARAHAEAPALASMLDELLAGGAYEGVLAVTMARAVRARDRLAAALAHRSLIVRRLAIDALAGLEPVPGDSQSLPALVHALAPALRRALLKAIVRHGRRAVARALLPEVLARYGPRDAAVLLPGLEDSQLRAALPGLAHAVGGWRSLLVRHPEATLAYFGDRLAAATPREQAGVWLQHRGLARAIAELRGAALLDLMDRFPAGWPEYLIWPWVPELVRVDAERVTALIEAPRMRALVLRGGLGRPLLNQLVRFTPAQQVRLGRVLAERPELLAPLLQRLAPGRREPLLAAVHADQELALRVWPDVFLDSLPRALQRREARRMLGLAAVQAEPTRVQDLHAYLALADAQPVLLPALKAADAALRGPAVARLIACAGREGAMTATLTLLAPRLKNDQDPVRLAAFTALARVPTGAFVDADAAALRALVTAATEARDTSYATRQQIQALAFRLLRGHATHAAGGLFQVGLDLLALLAGQTATLALPDLSRGLPRRSGAEMVAALAPRIAAASARDRPGLVLALATALGRRAHGLPALTALLEPLIHSKPDAVASRAIGLLLADPRGRDARVERLLAWDPSVIVLHPVLMHVHRRRQAWLDPFLTGATIKGRFHSGKTIHVLPVTSGFHRWLPRQQRAFAALLERAAGDRGHAHVDRAAVIARLARLPIATIADFTRYLESAEVPVIEAALAALAWLDAPAEALPVLLEHLDGDRARVAMYALPRVARYLGGAALTRVLVDLLADPGRKITVQKEALRLLGEHRSAASVPTLQAALARPGLHKDVVIAIGHAARNLLDDPRALAILGELARSPEADVARSLLGPRPDLLPAPARPGYAALILALARHPDLATRRLATAALPTWSSGQEAEIAGRLAEAALDLDAGDTWREACAALAAIAGDGQITPIVAAVAAGLAARADDPGPDPRERDLPARQRLRGLVEPLRGCAVDRRLAMRGVFAAVARAIAGRDDLWPTAAALRVAAIGADDAVDTLAALAADARADAFLGVLVACLKRQVADGLVHFTPDALLQIAAALAGGPATAARLALVAVVAAGRRTDWPGPARARLLALREHADLRVRQAARAVFMRPEPPAPGSDAADERDDLEDDFDDD